MTARTAFRAAEVFDGARRHVNAALLVSGGLVQAIVPDGDLPGAVPCTDLGPGVIAPGFVDLQVNGGGGVMFNDRPDVATLQRISEAHGRLGATAILPTLITDTPETTQAAIAAAIAAIAQGVPGIAGLHLEGPHLDPARQGAHDPALIRPMQEPDLRALEAAAAALPVLIVTLAPEAAEPSQIGRLARAGAVVSLGHTDAGFDACARAVESGASCVTHLFNAMRQLGNREPGVVGAALSLGALSAGLIADGIHVHPASLGAAIRGKAGPGRVFLVSDAMAVAGTDLDRFMLNGREIRRADGRLTLADGTLAGADLDLATAIGVVTRLAGIAGDEALAMATSVPAGVIGQAGRHGHLRPGSVADFVHLGADGALAGVWRGGTALT